MKLKTFFLDLANARQEVWGSKGKVDRFWAYAFIPLVWISLCLSFYFYFLQPHSTTLSAQRLLASGLAGLAVTLGGIWVIQRKSFSGMLFSRERLINSFLGALICCVFLWILGGVPGNFLFAKPLYLDFTIQAKGSVTGPVEIVWMNDGLGDISYRSVKIPQSSSVDDQSIQIPISVQERSEFSWSGRVWQKFEIVMRSPQPIGVTVDTGSGIKEFDFAAGSGDHVITISAADGWYYLLAGLLVYVFSFLALSWLIFLIGLIPLSSLVERLEKKIPGVPLERVVAFLGITAFILIFGFMVRIGFYNRMYADDYCYLVMVRQNGFWGAIVYAYLNQNGRLMSHLFNFSALSFGSGSIPYGPVVVLVLVGGSLFFLISQLLVGENKARFGLALFSTLFVMTVVHLMLPDLYNSVFWTLHALIVAGGIFFLNIFLGFLARFGTEKMPSNRTVWLSGLFFILNMLGAAFNEAMSLVQISLLGLMVIFLLGIGTKGSRKSGLLIPLLFSLAGSLVGLASVLFSPGNNKRISAIGFSLDIIPVIHRLYLVIQENLRLILINQLGTGLVLIAALLLTGYAVGRLMPLRIRWLPDLGRREIHPLLLVLLPFGLTVIPFVPSAFLHGFFPARTLFIPIYVLNVCYFFSGVICGFMYRSSFTGRKILPYGVSLMLVYISITAILFLGNFSRNMQLFAGEWDAREIQIQQAVAAGNTEVRVTPYQSGFGSGFVDLSASKDRWFTTCLADYYHISFSIDNP